MTPVWTEALSIFRLMQIRRIRPSSEVMQHMLLCAVRLISEQRDKYMQSTIIIF